jgi:hypothetical protein
LGKNVFTIEAIYLKWGAAYLILQILFEIVTG